MKRSSETGAIGSLLGCGDGRREPTHLGVAEALHEMIVDHSHRLHERVADRRADEPKVAPDERGAHAVRFAGAGRKVAQAAAVELPERAPHKAPQEGGERAVVLDEREKRARVRYSGPPPLPGGAEPRSAGQPRRLLPGLA